MEHCEVLSVHIYCGQLTFINFNYALISTVSVCNMNLHVRMLLLVTCITLMIGTILPLNPINEKFSFVFIHFMYLFGLIKLNFLGNLADWQISATSLI